MIVRRMGKSAEAANRKRRGDAKKLMSDGLDIRIPTSTLKAALLHVAKHDVRYYLNGVLIEPISDGTAVFVVATDGHRMIAIKVEQETVIPKQFRKPMILSEECLSRDLARSTHLVLRGIDVVELKGKESKKRIVRAELHYKHDARWVLLKLVDGVFPRWRDVMKAPLQAAEAPSCLNPRYIIDAIKANYYLLNAGPARGDYDSDEIVSRRGDLAAIINYRNGNAIGMIMPMRGGTGKAPLPDWVAKLAAVELNVAKR